MLPHPSDAGFGALLLSNDGVSELSGQACGFSDLFVLSRRIDGFPQSLFRLISFKQIEEIIVDRPSRHNGENQDFVSAIGRLIYCSDVLGLYSS
jgi:hypothetical protein